MRICEHISHNTNATSRIFWSFSIQRWTILNCKDCEENFAKMYKFFCHKLTQTLSDDPIANPNANPNANLNAMLTHT